MPVQPPISIIRRALANRPASDVPLPQPGSFTWRMASIQGSASTAQPTITTPTPIPVPPQEATILYDAAGNEIERVYGDITIDNQFFNRTDIVRIEGGTSTNVIGLYAFDNCTNLINVNLPEVTFINVYAFQNCINLTTVNLPKVGSINVGGFFNCISLPLISLPLATSIGGFGNCSNLTVAKLNCSFDSILQNTFVNSGLTTVRLRPAPNTPAGWTIGPGQTIGDKTNVTVVADWTDWPN